MRDPHRTRARWAAAAAVGWAAIGAAYVLDPRDGPARGWVIAVFAIGLNVGVICTTLAVMAHGPARALDRMRRGEGVLAQWTVDPARWALFVAHARQLAAQPGARANMLALPDAPPALGYRVTVSEDAIRLEEEFEPMRRDAEARVAGAVLEFRQLVQLGKRMDWWTYRLPIGAGAEADAGRVAAHYAASRARRTRPMRKLLVIAVMVGAVAAFILVVGTLTDWR
ncbi:hypothetical protein [Roseisolibacter sp. H3M3-2]|uniref:hypothetical protein n=1 Tax=Roseisolibacter sp. H3M3-2 TaxID=3031323 RepID=UPI0023DB68B7|nr:hypothetical protein [Roseisolibacter sp. H3M3-2]MDF1504383.1 hypothetical protein [Roseisolibacter sp. H3M3-2]